MLRQMNIDIVIEPNGQVHADVVDGVGPKCITEVLAGLEELLGEASVTHLKPSYEWDEEVLDLIRQQEVRT